MPRGSRENHRDSGDFAAVLPLIEDDIPPRRA
jgi:hypothetical protein